MKNSLTFHRIFGLTTMLVLAFFAKWVQANSEVTVAPKTSAPADLVTRVYSLINQRPTTQPASQTILDDLANEIRRTITPEVWKQKAHIDEVNGQLIVYAPSGTQEKIAQLLKKLQDQTEIVLSGKILSVDSKTIRAAHLPVPTPSDKGAATPILITADQVTQFEQIAHGVKCSPHTRVFNNSACKLYQLTYIPYVGALNVQQVGGKKIAAPIVAYAQDGNLIEFA